MAQRRMVAKTIIDSDAFLDMPQSSQLLYLHLLFRADDEGFVNQPKTVMRIVGSKDDDLKILIAKKFIIPFESGVIVIKHWKIHNYIQRDRFIETKYKDERAQLQLDDNSSYQKIGLKCIQNGYKMDTDCIQNTGEVDPQVRIGKSYSKSKDKYIGVSPFENFWKTHPEFEEPLRDYRKMRVSMKKKMTDRAEEMFLNKLKDFIGRGYDGIELVDMAIEKNWLSVYEPQTKKTREDIMPTYDNTPTTPNKMVDRDELIKKIKSDVFK